MGVGVSPVCPDFPLGSFAVVLARGVESGQAGMDIGEGFYPGGGPFPVQGQVENDGSGAGGDPGWCEDECPSDGGGHGDCESGVTGEDS